MRGYALDMESVTRAPRPDRRSRDARARGRRRRPRHRAPARLERLGRHLAPAARRAGRARPARDRRRPARASARRRRLQRRRRAPAAGRVRHRARRLSGRASEPVVVAGTSLGGCLALRLAEHPGELRLAGVVPVAPDGLEMPSWFDPIEEDPIVRRLLSIPVPVPGELRAPRAGRAPTGSSRSRTRARRSSAVVDAFSRDGETRADVAALLGVRPRARARALDRPVRPDRHPLPRPARVGRARPDAAAHRRPDGARLAPDHPGRADRGRRPAPAARGHRPAARAAAPVRDLSAITRCAASGPATLFRPCAGPFSLTLALFLALVRRPAPPSRGSPPASPPAGTDVSGLTLAEAAGKLDDAHGFTVGRPLSTHVAGRKFAVTPGRPRLRLRRQQVRAARVQRRPEAAHDAVDVAALHRPTTSKKVTAYANKVAATVKRNPRDARVDIKLRRIGKVAVHATAARSTPAALASAVGARAAATRRRTASSRRSSRSSSRRSRPPAWPSAYGTIVTIDRGNFKLRLFKRLKLSKTYGVAVGMPGLPDADRPLHDLQQGRQPGLDGAQHARGPAPTRTRRSPGGSAENPLKARWMGIVNGVGHPRHRRAGLDRLAALRTAASA